MMNTIISLEGLVLALLGHGKHLSPDLFKEEQRVFAKANNLSNLPSKSQILQSYRQLLQSNMIKESQHLELMLRKRAIRSLSGIVSVQVLTKPFPCPSHCIFCPNDPEMPKSYIKSEPGAMRAFLNQFDPLKQVYNRLYSLKQTGHKTDKIEMIVLGGTWDFYPDDYKLEFIKHLYDACNTFEQLKFKNLTNNAQRKYAFEISNQDQVVLSSSLAEAIQINETAKHRIIGLTIETRPEFVTDENCQTWRMMGVTRIEMGVQSTDNEVLDLNKRGHHIEAVEQALHKLRQYGFKFSIHIMPGLYGSSKEKDIQTFVDIYQNPYIKPDEIKLYPTSVIPSTELYDLYKSGDYQPITSVEITEIVQHIFREIVPPYTRIKRLIRDIPATEISAGSNVTNLSQLMHEQFLQEYRKADSDFRAYLYQALAPQCLIFEKKKKFYENIKSFDYSILSGNQFQTFILGSAFDTEQFRHFVSLDTRSREVRNKVEKTDSLSLIVRAYQSSVGIEYFISYEDELGYLYGFTRLLLPNASEIIHSPGLGAGTALIRELHVYGALQSIEGENDVVKKVQHSGLGKKLLDTAEQIAKNADFERLSVISGVGVRAYYYKLGYQLEGTYVLKGL